MSLPIGSTKKYLEESIHHQQSRWLSREAVIIISIKEEEENFEYKIIGSICGEFIKNERME